MDITVVIPSLDPDEKLLTVVDGLVDAGFTDVVLVDDGSDDVHRTPFTEAARRPGVTVLHHPVNYGKGRALKTAFAYILEHCPHSQGVITVDGDGQHTTADIVSLAQAMRADGGRVYLGSRDFSRPDVPLRSRFGNKTTSFVFRLMCGLTIRDTQTGLRAFPRQYLPAMLEVEGERFEYETNMLLAFRQMQIPFIELPICTVYINENETSHFRPIRDSVRIYRLLLRHFFRFVGSGALSFFVDMGLFWLFSRVVLTGLTDTTRIFAATAVARAVSSLFNFFLNRTVVFSASRPLWDTLWRYYTLCAVQMLTSATLVTALCWIVPVPETLIKFIVDVCLMFVSFRIQQRFVFGRK